MSDELKPQSIGNDPEFCALLKRLSPAHEKLYGPTTQALIAHINAWGARLASVPEGYVVVPWQPTQAMQTAGFSKMLEVGKREVGQIYAAMLAASPTPDKEPPCGS